MPIAGAFVVPHPPLILPEIGRGEEARIADTCRAYREVARLAAVMRPETVVIVSPHAEMFRDYIHISPGMHAQGDFGNFGQPQLELRADYDAVLVEAICRIAAKNGVRAGVAGRADPQLDHGTMIPLRFLQEAYEDLGRKADFRIVRVGLSLLPLREHFRLGACIAAAAKELDRRIVVIASGDLSHYLSDEGPYSYAEEGPEYDRRITEILASGNLRECLDFEEDFCERAGECGHRAFCILAGCLDRIPVRSRLLSYQGPFGVGYAVAAFQDVCTALARSSLRQYLETGSAMHVPEGLPEELAARRAGVFVSLEKDGQLRGCIGTIQGARANVAEEIIANAVSAGIYDPRFPKVTADELEDLIITVDVLGEARQIQTMEELDVRRYGVIVTCSSRRGLLLPNLDGVRTPRQQVDIALQKAGIDEEEPYTMERFEVVRHY